MGRKYLTLIFVALFIIPLIGCGIKNLLPSKEVPPLESYSTVVLLPFDFDKPSQKYGDLPILVSYGIGTKLGARHQDRNWIFDQSKEVNPVSEKLKELNISANAIYKDPQAAAKVAEAFQADLIIAGKLDEPKFTREDSGKIKYDMSETSGRGAARYYTVYQTATLPSDVKVIDPKSNGVIWDGKVIGYKKYETDYRTGNPKLFQRDETMMADVRKDLVENFVNKLYPAKVASEE